MEVAGSFRILAEEQLTGLSGHTAPTEVTSDSWPSIAK